MHTRTKQNTLPAGAASGSLRFSGLTVALAGFWRIDDMRTQIGERSIQLWLSARDTYDWANRDGASWPCSMLADHRLFAAFDTNGLVDYAIDGKTSDVDSNELSACCADHLASKLPKDHPCFDVVVGQFKS
jgi:hypothetical protein